MIAPVLEEGATTLQAYIPNSRFYSYYTGEELPARGVTVVLPAPLVSKTTQNTQKFQIFQSL